MNSNGDSTQLCRTPCLASNHCECSPVIRTHVNPHVLLEIADDCNNLGWDARECEYCLPQQLSVYRVIRFLQIDESTCTMAVSLCRPSSRNQRTTNSLSIVDRAGRESHCCSSRSIPSSLAVVAEAGCDDVQQRLTCVGNERNPSVAAAISPVLLLVKHLDDRIF